MNVPSHLLIRADAGGELGTGHVMRMLALAQAWQDRGGSVTLAACQCPEALISRLQEEAISFEDLGELELGGSEDARKVIELGKSLQPAWVVIDGYDFGPSYQQTLKGSGFKVLAVDDWGHCDEWYVDLRLNYNLHAEDQLALNPPQFLRTAVLAGPHYALLRREFRDLPLRTRLADAPAKILVTFGGVDPDNASGRIARAISEINLDWRVTVLAGPGNSHLDALQQACKRLSNFQILHNVTNMANLYTAHDAVISAAGSSCYEWLRYGLPALVYAIANNQVPLIPYLERIPNVEAPGWLARTTDDDLSIDLQCLAERASKPPVANGLIDGIGADRVISHMLKS
jgi:UDP-2,4-diacetamido-2,4,6-trideoxy-beta-L-altropyranose hydrolase